MGLLRRPRSFKVIEFGNNRKPICDFLLVINSNLSPVLHRFRDIASQRSKIATFFLTLFGLTPRRRGSPGTISVKFYMSSRSLKISHLTALVCSYVKLFDEL